MEQKRNSRADLSNSPISNSDIRQSGRIKRQPTYLRDYILLSRARMYPCDAYGKSYTNKRNLLRHAQEKNGDLKHWNCTEFECVSESFLGEYLEKQFISVISIL